MVCVLTRSLLELDAVTGAVHRRIRVDGSVSAAFEGDGVVWCTERAVYSLP